MLTANSRSIRAGIGLALLCAASALGSVTGCGTSSTSLCDQFCDCEGCSQKDRDNCVDDLDDLQKKADDEGCPDLYDNWVNCLGDQVQCRDGHFDVDGCEVEEKVLGRCL